MRNYRITLASLSIILLQSCTVYHNSSVVLGEATDKGKVKVVTNYGSTILFDKIEQKDRVYYGVGQNDTIQINSNGLSKIHLADTRKSHDFKNRVFMTIGVMPRVAPPLDEYFKSYGTYNINYERKINNYFSGRLIYGRSFITPDPDIFGTKNEREQITFYMATIGITKHKNNSHLEVNVGYALIHGAVQMVELDLPLPFIQEGLFLLSPVLEIGYRLTNGPFIFRNGVSWPSGRYISIGYAF